jgi:hypothetical protein
MLEIGVPKYIRKSLYDIDPFKYGFYRAHHRGDYTLLVEHDEVFYSFFDIAKTIKMMGIKSLFIILSKDEDTGDYSFLIGNSISPYDKNLFNKTVIPSDETFQKKLHTMMKLIEVIERTLNSEQFIVFPIGVAQEEVDALLGDLQYELMDITKFLVLSPVVEPSQKKMIPYLISAIILGVSYFASSYMSDYYNYDARTQLNREKSKKTNLLNSLKSKLGPLMKENEVTRNHLSNIKNGKVYR